MLAPSTMKCTIISSVVLFLFFGLISGSPKPEDLIRGIPVNGGRAAGKSKCDAENRVDCADCSTAIVCDRRQNVVGRIACGGDTPFCEKGKCVRTPTGDPCSSSESSDLCPAEGFYPNPSNCHRFNYCDENYIANEYLCPANYTFESKSRLCRAQKSAKDCFQIDCVQNKSKFVVYAPNPNIYVYCGQDGSPIVFECEQGLIYDDKSGQCKFDCLKEGYFPVPGDKNKYYECTKGATGQLEARVNSCPGNLEFDDKKQACLSPVISTSPATTEGTTPAPGK